jgi:ATP-dependent Clp protease ATP-binding subunit ClpB
VKEGFDRVYGARPLRRTIQRRIENPLAMKVLGGEFTDGDVVRVDLHAGEFVFEKAERRAEPQPEAEPVAVG